MMVKRERECFLVREVVCVMFECFCFAFSFKEHQNYGTGTEK